MEPEEIRQLIIDAYNQGYRDGENDGQSGVYNETDVAEYNDAEIYFNDRFEMADGKILKA